MTQNMKILYSVWNEYDLLESGDLVDKYWGPAITTSWEDKGCIYVTNGEYYSRVNYCPFTGKKATHEIGDIPNAET